MSKVMCFRLEAAAAAEVHRLARDSGYTPSEWLRALVEQALGADPEQAAIRQAAWRVHAALRKRAADMDPQLQTLIDEAVADTRLPSAHGPVQGPVQPPQGLPAPLAGEQPPQAADAPETAVYDAPPPPPPRRTKRTRRGRRGGKRRR